MTIFENLYICKSVCYKYIGLYDINCLGIKNEVHRFTTLIKEKKMKNFFTIIWMVFSLSFLINYSSYGMNHTWSTNNSLVPIKNYVENPSLTTTDFFPWYGIYATDPCPPSDQIFNLAPGQCGVVLDNFGFNVEGETSTPFTDVSSLISTNINSTQYCSSGQTKYSRIFQYNGHTDLKISSVALGIYQASNNPLITINFYDLNSVSLGGFTTTVPNINRSLYNASVPSGNEIIIPSGSSYILEVVTNSPHISVFKLGMNEHGYPIGMNPVTVESPSCQVLNQEIDPGSPGITPSAFVFYPLGESLPYKFINILNDYEEGDFFPIGTTPMAFNVLDVNGNTLHTCAFNIVVNEHPYSSNAIACNDFVNISMGDECELIITPPMILEGENYGCFDDFTVSIKGVNGVNLGNKVTRANLNQTLEVTVTNKSGNSCWGQIFIEDKLGPQLVCRDVYTNCNSNLAPGSLITDYIPIIADIPEDKKDFNTTSVNSRVDFDVPVGSFMSGTIITDLEVYLDITHPDVSQISAEITSPDGVTVPLFYSLSCNGQNLNASFSDAGESVSCEASVVPSVAGKFKPVNPLSIFNGKPLAGNWTVSIYGTSGGDAGVVNAVHLIFSQEGASIPFPTDNPVTFTKVNDHEYRVNGVDNCLEAILSFSDTNVLTETDCDPIYSRVIKRCWTGIDLGGFEAAPCCQYIYIYRNSLSTLVFPQNYDGKDGNPDPLSCFEYGDVVPTTDVTGVPTGNFCNNIQIPEPTDSRIDICSNSYKILRKHRVVEWCTGNEIYHNQIIVVMDNEGPEMICPADVTISTNVESCDATYKALRPEIIKECSDNLTYVLSYGDSDYIEAEFTTEGVNQLTETIESLHLGDNYIKWVVTDDCGNSSTCTYKVTVIDDIKPIVVCDQHTTTSISGDGWAVVNAISLDDGSHDNCGILKYEARKMTDKCGQRTDIYTPSISFCCEEVGTTVTVELLVTDVHGNTNICMVEVRVDDKLPPYITYCPEDITLDCSQDYKDLTLTGEAEAIDNCEVVSLTYQDNVDLDHCGVGTVTRLWTAVDKQGFKNSCVQVITLENIKPFQESDIIWPRDYETNLCRTDLDPEALSELYSKPRFRETNCSFVASHFKDQVFTLADGACEKILRTWTVLDWCTYNELEPVLGQGWYEHVQVLKIVNDKAPVFVGASGSIIDGCTDRTIPVYGNCEGDVVVKMYAQDDCGETSDELSWNYRLYEEDGLTLLASANSNTLNRVLPVGKYVIKWTVKDKCNNPAFCTQNVNVIEAKKPTPYCITSLTTAVMNNNGTIDIWANDFDKGSYDNCTPQDQLWFTFGGATPVKALVDVEHYFKGNGQQATEAEYRDGEAQRWLPSMKSSGRLFNCSDIPNGVSQEVYLDMTVTDLAGNQDYCTVIIVLQDNSGVCPDNSQAGVVVSGRVAGGGNSQPIVEINVTSDLVEMNRTVLTDFFGQYVLNNMVYGGNYTVSAAYNNNEDILNGVSTLDLVKIQRHILGVELFNDAKKVIASDADNSGNISVSDLSAIRKCILGITNQFPNGQTSWRFMTSGQVFSNNNSPFPFQEQYNYNNLTANQTGQNFIPIKIGDVDNDAAFGLDSDNTQTRSNKSLDLFTIVKSINNLVSLPIYADNFENIFGFQFTLEFDQNKYQLLNIEPGILNIDDSNFGLNKTDSGIITTSWSSYESITVDEDSPLFTLVFSTSEPISDNVITISSEVTAAESYDKDMNVQNVTLIRKSDSDSDNYSLLQNRPNPFKDITYIPFTLPEAAQAIITINDVNGKTVKTVSGYYDRGENTIEVRNDELGSSGVFFYRIESGTFFETRKMIMLE